MILSDPTYASFALIREMLETPSIIRNFSPSPFTRPLESLRMSGRLFFTGEGSSRIFPAKNAIAFALRENLPLCIQTQGCRQSAEVNLKGFTLFAASNSGKTKEVIALLKSRPAFHHFGLTASEGSPLADLTDETFVLSCGKEDAVAATKSVVEQGLFYHSLLLALEGKTLEPATLQTLSAFAQTALETAIDPSIVEVIARAPVIYFAGRNNGVAEEAALKTNEITRKKSGYLEGTYAVHGIEEVMNPDEVVIVVDPFESEEEKFRDVLVKGVGMHVIAVSPRKTLFPTVHIPSMPGFDTYLQLLACWNILVEVGMSLGINLDKPVRARKIGNEYQSPAV